MKYIILVISLLATFPFYVAAEESTKIDETQQIIEEQKRYIEWARNIWNSLDRQKGKITLRNNLATLNVPDNFYYLSPKDAETVLGKVWGNPPSTKMLGMLMPEKYTPFDNDAWGWRLVIKRMVMCQMQMLMI